MPRRLVRLIVGAGVLLAASALAANAQVCDSTVVARLPLIERPGTGAGATLVVLLTGDGGWAKADERVAEGLQARGGAVIGLNMRAYLGHRRSPDEVAADVACLAAIYRIRWRRPRLMLLGYSRGADIAPFVASRLPSDLREALNMVALVSPSQHANFQFHLIDLIRDVRRDDDVPLLPEIEKLRGLNVLCIYGRSDNASLCTQLAPSLARVVAREGGHRIVGGFDAMSDVLSEGLRNPKD